MIGVIADSKDGEVVCEFFELFKTPWEFYRPGQTYDVLLCAGNGEFETDAAKVVILYSGRETLLDCKYGIGVGSPRRRSCILARSAQRIPLYGESVTLRVSATALLQDQQTGECMAYLDQSEGGALVRVGYDLFVEVRTLLTAGQPKVNASIPALELHIAFLRDLMVDCGLAVAEIPPVPDGYRLIACLTHDVDHPLIRPHGWDHTTLGFLKRAILGSAIQFLRGRMPGRDLVKNWAAAVKLPLIQLGWAKDFWREFGDRYLEIESGLPSTFFVIPFANRPGKKADGPAPSFRGARYGARDIAGTIQRLQAAGCEVALHGIDAWVDIEKGREELAEIRELTGAREIGVRMHWLYYDRQSPRVLEEAGALFDSTIGYNETVGYRAGTTQAYRPFGTSRLIELPLHAMDTALFYPAHLALSHKEAGKRIDAIVNQVSEFGGCFTLNWHDRSIAPERLWGACYHETVQKLKDRGAWFATVSEATAWFRKRRSAAFTIDTGAPGGVRAVMTPDHLPGLQLRIHQSQRTSAHPVAPSEPCTPHALSQSAEASSVSDSGTAERIASR